MRLEAYLNEEEQYTVERAKELSLKYINHHKWQSPDTIFNGLKKTPVPFYRGVQVDSDTRDRFTRTPRTDRNPLDTPQEVHDASNSFFEKEFGWRVRSEGLFVHPVPGIAAQYSKDSMFRQTFIVFPKHPYKYVWSPTVEDFFARLVHDTTARRLRNKEITVEEFHKELAKLGYIDHSLEKIKDIKDGVEVMIKCSSYDSVNFIYYPWYLDKFGDKSRLVDTNIKRLIIELQKVTDRYIEPQDDDLSLE